MTRFFSSLRFFTVLPVGHDSDFDPKGASVYAPVAGLLIGLLLALFDAAAGKLWSTSAAAAIDVVFLAWITGALHLDGLADTADGLYGKRPLSDALRIMKDSRTGAIGVVSVVCCLAVKWAGLHDIDTHRFLVLILVPAYGRSAVLVGMHFLDYGRESGTAASFFEDELKPYDFRWAAAVVFLSVFAGSVMIVLNLFFVLVCGGMILFYKKRMGCITGDMLGAMIEVTETVLFLAASAKVW